MTVAELIEKLKTFDPDKEIVVRDYEEMTLTAPWVELMSLKRDDDGALRDAHYLSAVNAEAVVIE
jgi:hypothetical protein